MSKNTLAVIGGGAAGFFAGVNAARLYPDLHVIIFERSREVLSKVRISGGYNFQSAWTTGWTAARHPDFN